MKFLKSGLFTGVFMSASLVIPLVGTQHYEKRETANLQFAKQVQTTNASNENNIDIDLWNDFIDKVNDHSTDEDLLSLETGWTLTLHIRFMTSKFYAENILGKDLKSRTEFPPTFMNLFLSKEFTEMEKVIIGKRILNNVATRDYLKNIGLYDIKDENGNQINAVTPSEIYEKSNVDVKVIDTTLVMAEQPIKLEGATGYFQDWEITHPKSDRLFIVSNQDVMNDFLAILTHTKNYVELLKFTHDVQTRIFASDSTKITFVDAWNQFEDKVADLILETTGIYISLDHSFLGFITGFEPFYFSGKLGAGISSSEAYKSILSGSLGKAIFGSQDAITKEIEAFTSSPSIVKLSKETVLFSNIFEKLKYLVLESDFIKQFAKAKLTILVDKTDNPNLKDYIFSYIENNDTEKMLTTFASKIYKASGSLLRAIKINIINDLMLGDAIDIQRIDSSYHNYLNKLPTKFWNVNDSVIQTQETTPANLILNPIKEIDEWKLVHRTDRVVFPIWNNEIKINDGQPIDIGGSIFYLGLGIKSDGLNVNPWADYITLHDFDYSSSGPKNEHKTTRTVHTYEGGVDKWVENNHSDYPKIIHIVIPAKITSTSTVTDSTWDKWEIELDNVQLNYDELQEKLDGVSKLYYSTLPLPVWAESYIPIEIPNFNEHLREAIREAVTYTRNEFIKQDLYNPTSTYKITISIKNIDVKEVYFDKFSETQIKNLILKNISAALEIKIYEDEPVL